MLLELNSLKNVSPSEFVPYLAQALKMTFWSGQMLIFSTFALEILRAEFVLAALYRRKNWLERLCTVEKKTKDKSYRENPIPM